jgi:hypothetical protein
MVKQRVPGVSLNQIGPNDATSGAVEYTLAYKLVVGANADMKQGDPEYSVRRRNRVLADLAKANATAAVTQRRELQYGGGGGAGSVSEFAAFDAKYNIPDLQAISRTKYIVRDPLDAVSLQNIFWSNGDKRENRPGEVITNTYLSQFYFPFFSACKGSDSYLQIHKVLETDPKCVQQSLNSTIYVSSLFFFTGDDQTNDQLAKSDTCWQDTLDFEIDYYATKFADFLEPMIFGNFHSDYVPGPDGKYLPADITAYKDSTDYKNGAIYECEFEEDISITTTETRWQEAEGGKNTFITLSSHNPNTTPNKISPYHHTIGTALFSLGIKPFGPYDYEPVYADGKDGNRWYDYFWGRVDLPHKCGALENEANCVKSTTATLGTYRSLAVNVDDNHGGQVCGGL